MRMDLKQCENGICKWIKSNNSLEDVNKVRIRRSFLCGFCPYFKYNSTSIVPSISFFIKRVLCCHRSLFSLTSIGDFPHLTVLLTFSYNCTCYLCLHSFQVLAYCDCLLFLTILIQTYWSLKDNFTVGTIRVNYESESDMDTLNIQNKEFPALSIISGCWNMTNFVTLYMHECPHTFTSTHYLFQWTSEEPTPLSWFSYLSFFSGCGLCILHFFYLLKWCSGFWWKFFF